MNLAKCSTNDTVSLIATDGKDMDVAIADAQKGDIILVHWAAGAVLDKKAGGPVKLAFPDDAKCTYNARAEDGPAGRT
ncbi:MAG: hypothetical protein ACREIJ_06700 [Nitrospiraceae bacterium]